jgi:hypothetical protein
MSKSVLVAVANDSQQSMSLDVVSKWDPDKISFFGDTVFFKVEDTYLSMKKLDFCNIFTEKCAFIKYK